MAHTREVLTPSQTREQLKLEVGCWAYVYTHTEKPWKLIIGTVAEPNSGALSLGGFRIVPAARAASPDFNQLAEAVGLSLGMTEKVYWSKLMKIGGPRGIKELHNVVGGKCVLLTNSLSRVGEKDDFEMLTFAAECLHDTEKTGGFRIVTGQDLGHGIMSDGRTQSLAFLHDKFHGSVLEDTSQPTGEGNFYAMKGMLAGIDTQLNKATVGFLGCGNVGERVLKNTRSLGANVFAIEPSPKKAALLRELGVEIFSPEDKQLLLAQKIDALCVNANGGSLDTQSIKTICANNQLQVICGSENLVMPHLNDEALFTSSRKLYCPTELGGMMGYLTAVEEYLTKREGSTYAVEHLFDAAKRLEEPCRAAAKLCRDKPGMSFSDAIVRLHS